LRGRGIAFDPIQILELFMTVGAIPYLAADDYVTELIANEVNAAALFEP
jgi:hypothetical protein